MSDPDFDPALFGYWPKAPVYGGGDDAALNEIAHRLILETKAHSVSPLDDLQDMLNGMTKELREQMQQFRRLRQIADDKVSAAGEEIDRKAIQADAKASIEAMSVIVRTLEKIDSLQRTIAHDRQLAADSEFDAESYKAFVAEIDLRVERRAQKLFARYVADAGGGGGAIGDPDPGGGASGNAAGCAPRASTDIRCGPSPP